eukprot:5108451-Prymnesium_polylepis.2
MLKLEQLHGAHEGAAVGHRNLDLDAVSPYDEARAAAGLHVVRKLAMRVRPFLRAFRRVVGVEASILAAIVLLRTRALIGRATAAVDG